MANPQHASRDTNRVPTLLGAANDGTLVPVEILADPVTGRLLVNATISSGLVLPNYDYISNTSTAVSDTYRFYLGGSGGLLVATIALVYTDSSKATISTVTKS